MRRILSLHLTDSQIALGVKAAAVLTATIALFSQDLLILFSDALQNEVVSYILAIPVLFTYLIYRKRRMLRAAISAQRENPPREHRYLWIIAGVLLFSTAVLLYWHGSYTFTPLEYHLFALPIFVAGLSLIFFNLQTLRQLLFPITFLLFLTPPPSDVLYNVGFTLSVVSSEASNAIVNALGIASTIISEYGNPTIIVTRPDGSSIPFTVDIACSGIYSLIGFLIFVVFIAYIIRDKPWKKLAMVLIGVPLVYLLNIMRITIIILIGYHYGEALALQAFHLLGGWILIFLGTLLLLLISEKILKTQIIASPPPKCPTCNSEPTKPGAFCWECGRVSPSDVTIVLSDMVKIVALALCVILLTSIQAPVFAVTQAPTVIINTPQGQQVSEEILPSIPNYTLSFYYRDTTFEARAKQDFSLIYLYSSADQRNLVWVAVEVAPTRSSLHAWEKCLITWPISTGYQPIVNQIALEDVQLIDNPPIIGRFFVFSYKSTNVTQAVLYWYETATFTVDSTSQQKHVKISVIAYPDNLENITVIENRLVTFATAISSYWQPIKTWSQITMLISQNGINLVTATSLLLVATSVAYIPLRRRQRKANRIAYGKLSKPDKQLVDAVRETARRASPTLHNVAAAYQKTTGQTIDNTEILQMLTELEKTGTIANFINNTRDEPTQIWKAQI